MFARGTRTSKLILALFVLVSLGLYLLFVLQGYPLGILATVLAGFAAAPLAVVLHALSAEDAVWRDTWKRWMASRRSCCGDAYLTVVGAVGSVWVVGKTVCPKRL